MIRTKVDLTLGGLLSTRGLGRGYKVGGGVMVLLPAHLGVRMDYRNVRSGGDVAIAGLKLPGAKLSFSRIAVGFVVH